MMRELVPDLKDPKVVMGIIYMMMPNNMFRVTNIVREYLLERKDDAIYEYYLKVLCYNIREAVLSYLASLLSVAYKENKEFVRRVVNEPQVIDAIINAHVDKYSFDELKVAAVAEKIPALISEENALKILTADVPRLIFNTFGYHPAIVNSIDLQVRWIFNIAEEPKYAVRSVPWYITDEALEAAAAQSVYKTIKFIDEFLGHNYDVQEKKALFTPEGMRRVVAVYAVSEYFNYGANIFARIKMFEEKQVFSKP